MKIPVIMNTTHLTYKIKTTFKYKIIHTQCRKLKKINNSRKEEKICGLTEISCPNTTLKKSTLPVISGCAFVSTFILSENKIFCSITFSDRIWTEPLM